MNAKRFSFSFPVLGAFALLAAAPTAQAQAVSRGLRSGGATQQPAPMPSAPPVQTSSPPVQRYSAPMQRPVPMQQPVPMERRPGPVWNRPQGENSNFSRTAIGAPPVQVFGREFQTGPAVTVPDEANRHRRRDYPQNYGNGFGTGTSDGRAWTNGAPPPIGPGNGFFNNQTPPVGPGNGFGQPPTRQRDYPQRWQGHPHRDYGSTYIYNNYPGGYYPPSAYAPPLLGGYYFGNYSSIGVSAYTYPSVYSVYAGFPAYIYGGGTNVVIVGQPYQPVYDTTYLPFTAPTYPVTYNQNNYYVASEDRVQQLQAGGDQAKEAIKNSWPAGSYQAAFGDIARAWTDGDIALLKKHLRDDDTRLSVSINKKYAYSLKSGDYAQITRDALARLGTLSFEFTRLRKAKNGDVTAYGSHVYRAGEATAESAGADGATVPFDQTGPTDGQTDTDSTGPAKTVYVSYTLRHQGDQWYIVSVDSSDTSLVPAK